MDNNASASREVLYCDSCESLTFKKRLLNGKTAEICSMCGQGQLINDTIDLSGLSNDHFNFVMKLGKYANR